MTVIVGFVGSDGAVLASDSEGTESGHTRLDIEKIWEAGSLVLGHTGNSAVKQPLEVAVDRAIKQHFGDASEIKRWEAASAIQDAARPVLERVYGNFVGFQPGHHAGHSLAGALLVVGRDEHGYWLLELDGTNSATFYTGAGFHTVGSGASAAYVAQGLMKDYLAVSRSSMAHLKLVAYRTVSTCIDVLGGQLGVGGHVQLWYSEDGKPFSKASTEESEAMANGVQQWTTIERESLTAVVRGDVDAPTASVEDAMLPEPLDDSPDQPPEAR